MTVSESDSKVCPRCRTEFSRRPGTTDLAWRSTSYCTPRCATVERKRRDRERRRAGTHMGWRPFGDGPAWNGLPVEEIEQLTGAVMRDNDWFELYEEQWEAAHPVVRRMVTVTERNGRTRTTTRFEEV